MEVQSHQCMACAQEECGYDEAVHLVLGEAEAGSGPDGLLRSVHELGMRGAGAFVC